MAEQALRHVLVLINPRSGILRLGFDFMRRAFDRHWEVGSVDLCYQFTQSAEDGAAQAQRAVRFGLQGF